jgi:multiple antibiotic resistance protein
MNGTRRKLGLIRKEIGSQNDSHCDADGGTRGVRHHPQHPKNHEVERKTDMHNANPTVPQESSTSLNKGVTPSLLLLTPALALALLWALAAVAASAQSDIGTAVPSPDAANAQRALIDLGQVFTYFFVMLGPLKALGPFVKMTRGVDEAAARKVALRAFLIATVGGLGAAVVGQNLLKKWSISLAALMLAAGLVLLLVALRQVLAQYADDASDDVPDSGNAPTAPATLPPGLAFAPLAFPTLITPYGAAALIVLLAASPDRARDLAILGLFVAVMGVDLLAMWFARPILKHGKAVLAILGAVLGILQVALAVQILLSAGQLLGVLPRS